MDKMKDKRMELAKKLAQKYENVEDFEAAGGKVEDMKGDVAAYGAESVVSSPKGGETPLQALQSYKDESKRLMDIEERAEKSRASRFNTDLDDPMFVERVLKMESMGALKLSPEMKKQFIDAAKTQTDLEKARQSQFKIKDAARDLSKELLSGTSPYRESGSE